MKKILVVTHNPGKVSEFQTILKDYQVFNLNDFNLKIDIEENGETYQENALLKVKAIHGFEDYLFEDYLIVADDSGIEIDVLKGRPGIYSARYLGENTSYKIKNQQILSMLKDETKRTAYFKCGIALKYQNSYYFFSGELKGEIALQVAGKDGFGYDPIFYLPEYQKTTAELSDYGKNKISHRKKALEKLADFLKEKNL